MYGRSLLRTVKFFPQIQIGQKTQFLKEVGIATDNLNEPSPDLVDDIPDLRKKLDYRLWHCIATREWEGWEEVADLYQQHSLPMDEVSYTLMCHGYLMSHHHPSSLALLVIDRMKNDKIHPAVVKLNENLLNSFFDLSELGIKSSSTTWINVARLAWMSAARLRNKRVHRVRQHLRTLTTDEVLQVDSNDVKNLIEAEHARAQAIADDNTTLLE